MAASTSTAADSNNNRCYNVFISHRGPDVKKTFASHLYRRLISYGLRVFLDYQELQEGEDLTCQIKDAIRTSSVHVAIFSPTYADSQWCLDELVLMLESSAPIIPVFHGVEPAEVRRTRKRGIYARSLHNLEMKRADNSQPRYNSKTIENWRNALSRVADISGLDLKAFNSDEGELVDKVVEAVLKKNRKTQLNVARYPTGLDEMVEDFERKVLSQQQSGTVQFVGITGLGGAGKTTLAKELFNRKISNYSKYYFLFDVRENAKNSLPSLQRRLLKGLTQSDEQIDSIDEGIEKLKKHISDLSSRVLLVLDDIDHQDQVYALLPEGVFRLPPNSLILITSRDKNVLSRSGVQEPSIYKLTGLNTERSRQLFCSHAFCQPHPLPGFEYLVSKFLTVCNGLPLSLKVLGALLYGNTDISFWEDELERLEQILPDEIQMRLKSSYDSLQRDEQQMFLDIACFFIGESRDTAIRVWDGSGWKGSRGFQSLLNKCLVDVANLEVDIEPFHGLYNKIENQIRMHDHLRDLGRDIAKDSGFPCRLWCGTKDIDAFLQQSSEATNVRGIRMLRWEYYDDAGYASSMDDDERVSFSRYKMKHLQLLDIKIEEDHLKCLLEGVDSPKLLWFRWSNCPCSSLPPCIPMKKLRVLEVDGYHMKTLWQEELQAPLQLRELRIYAPLSKIPKSIGQLKHLEHMVVLVNSSSNIEIPNEFCDLRSLKHLRLGIPHMSSLPGSFGNLSTLEHVDLSGCIRLKRLPDSFGNLIKLKYLDLKHCSNITLCGGTFGKIVTIEYIDLTGCHEIEVLPSQIAHQWSLEKLHLQLRNLKEWPSSVGESSGLEVLVLETPLLETLPPLLGRDLRNLKQLELRSCRNLKHLPDSFLLLNQLTEWVVKDCAMRELCFKTFEGKNETLATTSRGRKRLSSLDSSFDKYLQQLQHLQLCRTKILKISFPTGICPKLEHLQIEDCKDLVEVGTLPTALIKLELITCHKLKKIQGLCGLAKLKKLCIQLCKGMEELSTETLVSLEKLEVFVCLKLKNIQGLAHLAQLRVLRVYKCPELEDLSGLQCLSSLEKFMAVECVNLKSIRCSVQLTKLLQLNVSGCSELEELAGLEHLSSLKKLWAYGCVKLKSIQGLAQLTQLRELYVDGELRELYVDGKLRLNMRSV